jgi:hypothetical protein
MLIARIYAIVALGLMATLMPATAEQLTVVGWNVENWGTSDPANNATQLRDGFDQIDVFGLSEVHRDSDFALYADYAGRDEASTYKVIPGTTGNNVRLGIVFREETLELLDTFELSDLQFGSGGRAPLVAQMRIKPSGSEFLFVVNHLHRGDEKKRMAQAVGLREWAREQALPVIAVGDYNFDVDVATQKGNYAYDAFLQEGVFRWLQPDQLVATNWSDKMPADGVNDYDSVLDFVFVSGSALNGFSRIVVRPGDFPDDEYTSDHRAVLATLFPGGTQDVASLDAFAPNRDYQRARDLAVFAQTPRIVHSGTNAAQDYAADQVILNAAKPAQQSTADSLQAQIDALRIEIQELRKAK